MKGSPGARGRRGWGISQGSCLARSEAPPLPAASLHLGLATGAGEADKASGQRKGQRTRDKNDPSGLGTLYVLSKTLFFGRAFQTHPNVHYTYTAVRRILTSETPECGETWGMESRGATLHQAPLVPTAGADVPHLSSQPVYEYEEDAIARSVLQTRKPEVRGWEVCARSPMALGARVPCKAVVSP